MATRKNSVGDRYRHRLRGQLADDAKLLEEYLQGDDAEGRHSPTGAQEAQAASLSGTG